MADLYCLSDFVDFSIIQDPLKHSNRIKYTCFDISERYIVLGSSSGSIYVFNEFGKFLHLIPNGNGAVTNIQISPNEKYVAFSQRSLICVYAVNLSAHVAPQIIVTHLSSEQAVQVTCIHWTQDEKQFYYGDTRGQVNLVVLSSFIGHNLLLNMTVHPILFLESPIAQLDDFESLLLVSTYSKCILCNTEYEEYKQIGNKPRDGAFGACFCVSKNETVQPSRIYCARPGTRIWEVDFEGEVLQTHQYKSALAIAPSKIQKTDLTDSDVISKYEENDEILDYTSQNLQFGKIQMTMHGFLLAYTELGLYVFDMISSRVILWCNQFERILDCKVFRERIFIFTQSGSLYSFQLVLLEKHADSLIRQEKLLESACLMRKHVKYFADKARDDYELRILNVVKKYLIDKQEYEILNDLSVIFDAIVQCEGNGDNNSSGGSSTTVDRNSGDTNVNVSAECYSTRNSSGNGNENVYVLENAFCDNLKPQKSNDRHFKDALLTVTGKFGKNIIKYKFNIFADEQKKLVQDLLPSKERLLPFEGIKSMIDDNEEEIVCRSRKSHSVRTKPPFGANNDTDTNITAEEKTIYNLYLICKSSQIGNSKFVERYRALFDEYSSLELINLLKKLEVLFLNSGDDPEKARNYCYEMYFNYLDPELIWEVDEATRDYISDGFILLNTNDDIIRCVDCGFPLQFDNSCLFHDLGGVLLRYYWSRNEQEKCFNVLTQVPALFDVLAKLYMVENNMQKVLPIVINYGRPELLQELGKNFTFNAWIQFFELFKELQLGRLSCVNCESIALTENINRNFFYTWNCFLNIALDYLNADEILSLIYKWSSFIPNDALDREFYVKCLLKSDSK